MIFYIICLYKYIPFIVVFLEFTIVEGTEMYFGSSNLFGAGIDSRTRKGKNNFEIGTITINQKIIEPVEVQM